MTSTKAQRPTWWLGSIAVVTAFVFDPLGNVPNAAVLALLLIAGIQAFAGRPLDKRSYSALAVIVAIMCIVATFEILNPNVPDIATGLIGFRKSAAFLFGVAIGLRWRGSRMQGLRLTWWCMLATGAIALIVHFFFPSVEALVARSAGKYTALISGTERMQGLLAGPFHVSMLGAFLFTSALAPSTVIRQRRIRFSAAAIGLACVYFSQVRTGFVAVAAGALVMALVTGSIQRWAGRLLISASVLILGITFINPLTEAARSSAALRRWIDFGLEDQRITTRFDTWQASQDLIERQPFEGWGSGSAGDTLGSAFISGQHITAHNVFLKYAVEGGVLQGLLFIVLCIGLVLAVRPQSDPTRFGLAAAIPLLVFGFGGAAVESLPVSLGIAVIWGICAGERVPAGADTNSGDSHRRDSIGSSV